MRRRYTREDLERMLEDPEFLEQEAKRFEEAKNEKVSRGGIGRLIKDIGSIVAAPFTVLGEVIDEESKKKQAAGGGSRSRNSSNGQMDFMKSGWFDDDDDKPKGGGGGFYW